MLCFFFERHIHTFNKKQTHKQTNKTKKKKTIKHTINIVTRGLTTPTALPTQQRQQQRNKTSPRRFLTPEPNMGRKRGEKDESYNNDGNTLKPIASPNINMAAHKTHPYIPSPLLNSNNNRPSRSTTPSPCVSPVPPPPRQTNQLRDVTNTSIQSQLEDTLPKPLSRTNSHTIGSTTSYMQV